MRADVLLEHHDNVIHIDFLSTDAPPPAPVPEEDSAWWPRGGTAVEAVPGKSHAATRPLPARLSPRPVRVLRRRFARSQLAADLKEWAFRVGLFVAAVLCIAWIDPAIDLTPAGGTP